MATETLDDGATNTTTVASGEERVLPTIDGDAAREVHRTAEPTKRTSLMDTGCAAEAEESEQGDYDEVMPHTPVNFNAVTGTLKAARTFSEAAERWRHATLSLRMLASHDQSRTTRMRQLHAPELWNEFERLQQEHSGMLEAKHLPTLMRRLDMKLSKKQIKAAMPILDPEHTGKISLGKLDEWYYGLKKEQQLDMRRHVKALFDSYAVNSRAAGGSVIEKEAFIEMMVKHGDEFNIPNFDPNKDMPELDESERVTFTKFELCDSIWWKRKTGVHTHTTDVLPEFLRMRLDEESYAARKQETSLWATYGASSVDVRSPQLLWEILRRKVKSISRMTDVWGRLDEVYDTNQSSAYGEGRLGRFIIDPDGRFAQLWDLLGVIMLVYVLIAIPVMVAFGVEITLWSIFFLIDVIVDIFFVLDVFLNFRTAYKTNSGHREGRPAQIARNYLKGWFLIDFVASLPVQYISYAVQSEGDTASENVKILKSVRLMRLTKMLRIARLRRFVHRYAEDVKAAQWLPALTLLFIILFLCHMLACAWYIAGGTYQELSNARLIAGWVLQEPDWYAEELDMSQTCVFDSTCRHQLDIAVQNISLATRYSTSLYYVFNALEHGFTDTEKLVAVISELTLGLIYGMLAGLMSSLLIVIGSGEAEIQKKVVQLRQWMHSHQMPKAFQNQALAYFHRVWETKLPVHLEQEMGLALPPAMNLYMKQHMYGTALRQVPLFRSLGQDIFAELCRRVKPQLCLSGECVMKCGDIGTDCFVLLSGELKVSEADYDAPDGLRFLGYLAEGAFFGEVPLLSNYASGSEVRKRTVQAVTESKLCYISQRTIIDMRQRFPELDARLCRFSMVGTSASSARKRLAKHNMDASDIRQLQQQTQQTVNAKLEGAIGFRFGDGHRLTRYQYDLISDWCDRDPACQTQPNDHPAPPSSPSPNNGRARKSTKSMENEGYAVRATKSLDALRATVAAVCPENDEQRSVRKRSIWIKYDQGFRAGTWREVFPYYQDTGWNPVQARFGKPQYFNALETAE